jgi:hypothetical protein
MTPTRHTVVLQEVKRALLDYDCKECGTGSGQPWIVSRNGCTPQKAIEWVRGPEGLLDIMDMFLHGVDVRVTRSWGVVSSREANRGSVILVARLSEHVQAVNVEELSRHTVRRPAAARFVRHGASFQSFYA